MSRCFGCNAPISGPEVYGGPEECFCDECWFHLLDLRAELEACEVDINGAEEPDLSVAIVDRQLIMGHIEHLYRFAPQTCEVTR